MFRRRRDDASPSRPPASSAWWDAPQDEAADAAAALTAPPPLPGHDPFGPFGAFPPPEDNASDAQQTTQAPNGQQLPPGWSVPPLIPPPTAQPGPPMQPEPQKPPVSPPPPPAEDPGDQWLPLLTHEHQRFQLELEEFGCEAVPLYQPPAPADQVQPWAPTETPKRGRRRGVRTRRSSPPVEPALPVTPPPGLSAPAKPDHPTSTPVYRPPEQPPPAPAPPSAAGAPSAGNASTATAENPAISDTAAAIDTAESAIFPSAGWDKPGQGPDPMEAAALAGAFAADYLSWDESSPQRRGQVLLQYLPSDVRGNASLLGWSGKGRQRSEFALPGAVRPDGAGGVVVDVRVRVTPYRAVGIPAEPASDPADQLEVAGVASAAPAPTARGWKSLDSCWVRLAVPIADEGGRLVVDTWDDSLDAPEGGDCPAPTESETTQPPQAKNKPKPPARNTTRSAAGPGRRGKAAPAKPTENGATR